MLEIDEDFVPDEDPDRVRLNGEEEPDELTLHELMTLLDGKQQ